MTYTDYTEDSDAALVDRFVTLHMTRHFERIADANIIALMIFNVMMAVMAQSTALPENDLTSRVVGGALFLLGALYFPIKSRKPQLARYYVVPTHLLNILLLGYFLQRLVLSHQPELTAPPSTVLMIVSMFLVLCCPFDEFGPPAMGLLFMGVATWATHTDFGGYHRFLFVMGLLLGFMWWLQYRIAMDAKGRARSEIQAQLRIAPVELVRRCLEAPEGAMEEYLAPRLQRCICLCSDWRGYQALARQVTPAALAAALEDYYEVARSLLTECLPAGSYFSDWSADELQVIVPITDEHQAGALAEAVLTFARRLVEAKANFAEERRLPVRIDVGVAEGVSVVGLAGPRRHRKIMAIGPVPALSRRLQALGKELRLASGEQDRIVYTGSFQGLAGAPKTAQALPAPTRLHPTLAPEVVYFEAPPPDSEVGAA